MKEIIFNDEEINDLKSFLKENKTEKDKIFLYIIKNFFRQSNFYSLETKISLSNYFNKKFYMNIKELTENSYSVIFNEMKNELKEDDYFYIIKNIFQYCIFVYNEGDNSILINILLNLIYYNIIEENKNNILDDKLMNLYFEISFNE